MVLRSSHLVCCLFATFVMLSGNYAGADSELEASKERLGRIQARIEQTEKSLKQKKAEVRSLRDELRAVSREQRLLRNRQQRLQGQLRELEQKQQKTEKDIAIIRVQLKEQRVVLEDRLAALYKGGGGGVVKLLFSGMGPSELETQFRYMLRVLRYDQQLLTDYREKQSTLEARLVEVRELKTSRQKSLADIRKHSKELARADRLKREILARVRKDQRLLASLKKELKEKAGRLAGLIDDLEKEPGKGSSNNSEFARQRGKLPWPAKGKVRIGFGPQRHPDLGTLFDSNGIEIAALDQAPIKAIWNGRVAFANAFKGYGNLVIIDHGDGFHTLYAHASRISRSVGDRVKQGDVLAYNGFPGTDGVYLEIRRNGKPVDPETWLSRRR